MATYITPHISKRNILVLSAQDTGVHRKPPNVVNRWRVIDTRSSFPPLRMRPVAFSIGHHVRHHRRSIFMKFIISSVVDYGRILTLSAKHHVITQVIMCFNNRDRIYVTDYKAHDSYLYVGQQISLLRSHLRYACQR